MIVAAVFVGEGETGAERNRGPDDPVPPIKGFLGREHCAWSRPCRREYPPRRPVSSAITALRIHSAGEHVTVIAIGR